MVGARRVQLQRRDGNGRVRRGSEAACDAATARFQISTEEFRVGLFQDIERAIAAPDTEVNKSMGSYITHRDYTTSRQINEFIDAGNSTFYVETRGKCWRLMIQRP